MARLRKNKDEEIKIEDVVAEVLEKAEVQSETTVEEKPVEEVVENTNVVEEVKVEEVMVESKPKKSKASTLANFLY